jgi:hypothetical protein
LNVGDRVRIERDEKRHPAKGTWPQFRGRTGTIVEINTDRKRPHLTEYGVEFGRLRSKPTTFGSISNGHPLWFKAYELRRLDVAAVRPGKRAQRSPEGDCLGVGK